MGFERDIRWSDEAVSNLDQILGDIRNRWSEKEVENFKKKLVNYLSAIQKFPVMFPKSENQPRLRRAVISSQTSVYYEVRDDLIILVFIWDNRRQPR